MPKIKTPDFKLSIGGIDFSDELKKRVHEINVDMQSDRASAFKVILDDRDDTFSNGTLSIKEGMSCVIELGYFDTGTKKLLEGIVTSVNGKRSEYSRKLFIVSGFDGLQALTRGRKRRSWEEIKDSDIAGIIANENGLEPDVDDSEIIQPYVVQNNETDLAFLYERARRLGFEVKVEEKRLVFKKPKRNESSGVTLRWSGGENESDPNISLLQRCNFDTSTMNVVKKVVVRSYDPGSAKEIIGVADQIDGDTMGGNTNAGDYASINNPDTTIQISDQPVVSQEEAEKLAASILNQRAGDYMTGRGRCQGHNGIVCGKTLSIQEAGSEMNGDYYVTSAMHMFKAGHSHGFGYWTDFTVSRTGH